MSTHNAWTLHNKTSACSSGTHAVIIIVRLYCSLRKLVDLVGALKQLHDLLHDLRLHALGLLELLAVAEDHSGGSLGDAEVRLIIVSAMSSRSEFVATVLPLRWPARRCRPCRKKWCWRTSWRT